MTRGGGTSTIRNTTYNTAKAIETFPVLEGKCLRVSTSWQPTGLRETLRPHWNGRTQTGNPAHAVVGKAPHAPVTGLSSGKRDVLDFARQ